MAVKFVVLAALVAVVHCSVVPVVQGDTDSSSFSYDVADPNTGDYKSQTETRVGGNVVGQYSLLEADGTKRTVDYTADDMNGFNAIVRNDPAVATASVVLATPLESATPVKPASPVEPATPVVTVTPIVPAKPSVVDFRTFGSPIFYAAGPVPSVYSSVVAPSAFSAFAPSLYAGPVPFAAPLTYW